MKRIVVGVDGSEGAARALRWAIGLAEKEGAEIIAVLEGLTRIDAETFIDPLTAYDCRIFGEWPFDLLGAVYAQLGQRTLAAEAFRLPEWQVR